MIWWILEHSTVLVEKISYDSAWCHHALRRVPNWKCWKGHLFAEWRTWWVTWWVLVSISRNWGLVTQYIGNRMVTGKRWVLQWMLLFNPVKSSTLGKKTGSRSFLKKQCQPQGQSVQVKNARAALNNRLCENRPANHAKAGNGFILEWVASEMVTECWTLPLRQRSGLSSASMTGMREPILATHCAAADIEKRLWDGLAPCHWLSKRLSQTCIAVILVWCDKHVRDVRNISKTGQFHPCIGIGTNWPRVNCCCCTLQYFIWPGQEWNKMDQSSFHCSWLALGAQSKGCFPSCFPHMWHGLAFSVSSINAALCSCQPAAFEVHLRQVGTKAASNQRRFQFQDHLFDHTDPLRGFQDHAEAHVDAKLAEIACHRVTVESYEQLTPWGPLHLLLRALLQCQFGMVEASAPLPAETRNCGAHRIKLKSPERKSSLEISHVESEAAWNRNPRGAKNLYSVPTSLV